MPFDLKTAVALGEVRYSIKTFVAVICSALIGIAVVKMLKFWISLGRGPTRSTSGEATISAIVEKPISASPLTTVS